MEIQTNIEEGIDDVSECTEVFNLLPVDQVDEVACKIKINISDAKKKTWESWNCEVTKLKQVSKDCSVQISDQDLSEQPNSLKQTQY